MSINLNILFSEHMETKLLLNNWNLYSSNPGNLIYQEHLSHIILKKLKYFNTFTYSNNLSTFLLYHQLFILIFIILYISNILFIGHLFQYKSINYFCPKYTVLLNFLPFCFVIKLSNRLNSSFLRFYPSALYTISAKSNLAAYHVDPWVVDQSSARHVDDLDCFLLPRAEEASKVLRK